MKALMSEFDYLEFEVVTVNAQEEWTTFLEKVDELSISLGLSSLKLKAEIIDNPGGHDLGTKYRDWLALRFSVDFLKHSKRCHLKVKIDPPEPFFGRTTSLSTLARWVYEGMLKLWDADDIIPSAEYEDYNVQGYRHLNQLEVRLRSLIERKMREKYKDKWLEHIPPRVLEHCKNNEEREAEKKWLEKVKSPLLSYAGFGDLEEIIEEENNWEEVFRPVFDKKEIIMGRLRDLEPVRNKIAHNRRLTTSELRRLADDSSRIIRIIRSAH